jgi:hypothetical protein
MKLPYCVGNLTLRQVFGFAHNMLLFAVLLVPVTFELNTLELAQAGYFMAWLAFRRTSDPCGAAS